VKPLLTRLVAIMWTPVVLGGLYTGWIFWQRHTRSQVPENPSEWNANPMAIYGKSLKILQFYAREREVAPNEKALICYGVINATAVRLDPPAEKVWPAVNRCFDVTPSATTRYTLTADGPEHTTVSQSIEIVVRRK
jgi:hypothetical protein